MIDKIDERNLAQERHTHFLHQCTLMEKTFGARRINFHPVTDKHDVAPFITSFIHQRNLRTIAFSDSVSLHECDVYRQVAEQFGGPDHRIINPFERTPDGKYKIFEDQPTGKLDLPRDEYYRRMGTVVEAMHRRERHNAERGDRVNRRKRQPSGRHDVRPQARHYRSRRQ